MRPVSDQFQITQDFASLPTRGVVGNLQGSMVQVLVAMYGDYQPDGHAGTDVGCPVGTPVRATRSGTVIYCNWDVNLPGGPNDWSSRWFFYQRFGGRLLLVQHAPNDIDVYAHLSAWKVRQGQFVNEGDLIALSGDSSAGLDGQLGPHLHTERIVNTNYPTGGGLIYGRTDPTTVWGGLAAQGSITQEEDMGHVDSISPEAARTIARAMLAEDVQREGQPEGQTNRLGWSLGAEAPRTEGIIARTAEAAVRGVLFTKFKRQGPGQQGETDLASVISWWDYGTQHAGSAAPAPTPIDPEAVKTAITAAVADALSDLEVTLTTGGPTNG